MGQLGIHHDSVITQRLLESAPTGSQIRLATGYFNLTDEYQNSIVNSSRAQYSILMAHPKVNFTH